MRRLIAAIVMTGCLATPLLASDNSKWWDATDKAKQFVKDAIVIDMYASPFGIGWTEPKHLTDYVDRAREAGITGTSATLSPTYYTWDQFQKEHALFRSTLLDHDPNGFVFVKSVGDIRRAHDEDKYALIWNSQTSTIIDGDLTKLATLREMGLSSMQLVYNGTYRTGDGVIEAYWGRDRGITNKGTEMIDEMVRQGIILDLSHTGEKTSLTASQYMLENHPGVPFIYTHSLPIGLYKGLPDATERGSYRNITDEQAMFAAKSGGVVAPTFTEWMMDGIWPDDITPQQAADMIDYYVNLIGVDHVGIATDDLFIEALVVKFAKANPGAYDDEGYMINAFDKGATGSAELAKFLPALTDELWKRGYSDEDLSKIYAGNMMRVYAQVWK